MNLIKTLFFTAAMSMFAASAQENLLQDGLKGWTLSNSRKIEIDHSEKVTEPGSLRLCNGATAIRTVNLEPDSIYELSFSVKGKEISAEKGHGAWITAHCKNVRKWFRITGGRNDAPKTGTFDWEKGSSRLDPAVLGGTELLLEFRLVGTGTVWFDDIRMKKVKLDKLSSDWRKVNPKQAFADPEVKLSGEYSIRLENRIQIARLYELEPGVQYELSYYLKGKDLASPKPRGGACLMVCGADRKRWAIVPTNKEKNWEKGTFDWRRGEFRFTSKLFGCDKILVMPTVDGTGTAWFDKIELKKAKELSTSSFRRIDDPAVREAAFYPLGVAGFFLPNETMKFQLEADGKGEAAYTVKLKDFSGKNADMIRQGKMALPGNAVVEFPERKRGYYVADAEIFINGKKACFLQSGAVSAEEIVRRDPFFQLGYGVFPELHDAYKRAGVGVIALKLKSTDHLSNIRSDINEVIAKRLNYYAPFLNSGDFVLHLTIGTTLRKNPDPKSVAEGRGSLNDKLLDHISRGIRLMAERTKGKIKEWNIGSEISSDATIAAKYSGTWTEAMFNNMVITRIASRIAKQIDPEIKIYCGGNSDLKCTYPYCDILFKDLHKEVDGYFIDAYTGNWDMTLGGHSIPEKSLRRFYKESSELAVKYGKDPRIKNGETGYAIHYGAAFDRGISVEQAALTARTIILTKASGIVKCFELHMPTYHGGLRNIKDDSSFMTTIWKPVMHRKKIHELPLPGGAMYATAARELAFAEIRKELTIGSNYGCIFTRPDGKTVAAVWNIEAPQELKINLKNDVRLIDMVGSETLLKKGSNTLRSSPEPVYLVAAESPGSIAEALSQAFGSSTPGLKFAAKRHDRETIMLFVRNPGVKPIEAEVVADGRERKHVTFLPGKINTVRVPLSRDLAIVSNKKNYPVRPDASYLPVHPVRTRPVFDGSGKWLAGLHPGKLRYPDDIYPKSALQPELCHFKTSFNPNGHNISADYYLAYDAENLYLAVKVDDPVHLQKAVNGELWTGDSIQWVISAADVPPKAVRSARTEQKIHSDLNFGLALTSKGPEYRRYLGKPGKLNYPCNVTRKGNITFYEAAVPWSELGVRPDSGKALRFSMVVFDRNSEATGGCPYCLAVTPGVAGGMDAGEYRLMIFEKE